MAFTKEIGNKESEAWALQLREALKAKGILRPSPMLLQQQHFNTLRRARTPAVVQKVLDWYCEHAGEEYVPLAANSLQFKNKFADILRAMERTAVLEVSEEAKVCAEMWAAQHNWPIEIRVCLPEIVERSLQEWRKFLRHMKAFVVGDDGAQMDREFFSQIAHAHPRFVQDEWIQQLVDEFGHKEHYFGNPLDLAFKPGSMRFKRSFWRAWSHAYSGKVSTFDLLLEELLK